MEIDSFGYMYEDALKPGEDTSTSGIYVVTPVECPFKQSVSALEDTAEK